MTHCLQQSPQNYSLTIAKQGVPQGTILGPTSFPSTFPLVNDKYDNTRSLQNIVNMRLIGKLACREQLNVFYATGVVEPLMLWLSYFAQQHWLQKK